MLCIRCGKYSTGVGGRASTGAHMKNVHSAPLPLSLSLFISRVLPYFRSRAHNTSNLHCPLPTPPPSRVPTPHPTPPSLLPVLPLRTMSPASSLSTLSSIFPAPTFPPSFLQYVLHLHSQNLNQAVDYILSQATPPSQLPPFLLSLMSPTSLPILISHLRAQFSSFPLIPLSYSSPSFSFSLPSPSLQHLHFHDTDLSFTRPQPNVMHVDLLLRSLRLHLPNWSYRIRFPPLRDAGSGFIEANAVHLQVHLSTDQSGEVQLDKSHCHISQGVVVNMKDARLSRLYNVLGTVLRKRLETSIADAIASLIQNELDQSRQWMWIDPPLI